MQMGIQFTHTHTQNTKRLKKEKVGGWKKSISQLDWNGISQGVFCVCATPLGLPSIIMPKNTGPGEGFQASGRFIFPSVTEKQCWESLPLPIFYYYNLQTHRKAEWTQE